MEEAQRLCNRVGIIDNGKLLALDKVENLIEAYGGKSILIAERNGEEIKIETDNPLVDLADLQQKGNLKHFSLERPDLETVFLNLTGRNLRD
jgi:ABC-2 type transport system ATP-binding protein